MKQWYRVFIDNKRILTFGFLFSFFSCFGQTFFISLFVPYWTVLFGISKTSFGSIYATVTIIAALLISFSGKYIDSIPLKKYALFVFIALILSMLMLSRAHEIAILTVGLFLVRWLGQGLMTHTSSTGIAKYFSKDRGKALSFSAMGHPAGNFIIPFIMLPLFAIAGWRNSLVIVSGFALLIMIPSILSLKKTETLINGKISWDENSVLPLAEIEYFKTLKFWIIALNIFILPFILTSVLLYQYSIGEMRGWSVAWVAFSFSLFAIFSGIGLLVSGNLVDRFTGRLLLPLYLVPALIGVLLLCIFNNQYVFPAFFALAGLSSGIGSTVKTAAQTEIYGIGSLGKVRSYFSTIIVLSTALGPPVFAFFIDRNVSLNLIMGFSGFLIFLVILASFQLWPAELFNRFKLLIQNQFKPEK